MNNQLFSLLIIPDSGNEVKTGSFNFKFVLYIFSCLVVLFFICLFFITGYHIKLSQEKSFKNAVSTHNSLLDRIRQSNNLLITFTNNLSHIQENDKVFRWHESMSVIDNDMYMAGIGGHVIFDDSEYVIFQDDLQNELKQLAYGLTSLDHRMDVQGKSLMEIRETVLENREKIDNTPTEFPCHSIRITSSYGMRRHPVTNRRDFHGAIDFGGTLGQNIYATADGIVTLIRNEGVLGNCIKIKHKYGYETLYGHLYKIEVKVGQNVNKGDVIGTMGRSGRSTGIHIHYAISLNGKPQNPIKYFK